MKKLSFFLLINLMFIVPALAQQGGAIVCDATGENCIVYSKFKPGPDEPWQKACCSDLEIPEGGSCTDDCSSSKRTQAVPPAFEETKPHFQLDDGRKVWIVDEDGELSEGSYDEQSDEYKIIRSSPESDWMEIEDKPEFVIIKINSDSYAIVKRLNVVQTKQKDQTASPALKELSKHIFEGFLKKNKITLYPNPVEAGEQVKIETLLEVESVSLFNASGKEVSPKLRKASENTYSFSPNGFSGVVYVKVFIKNGGVYKSKLVLRD